MNIGICGICGRMGVATYGIALERGHRLAAAFDSDKSRFFGRDAGELIHADSGIKISSLNPEDVERTDGVIDFSAPPASLALLELAKKAGKPVVIGTTGFSKQDVERIREAAGAIPVLFSPNMSLGINLLFRLTEIAASTLGPGYEVEIFEAHHRFKKDAPSGTANRIVEIVKSASKKLSSAEVVSGRSGMVGERGDSEIGVMAMRGGDIVGEHTVYFIGMGERIELTHRATSRDTLARGAVSAMEFISQKPAGLYSMYDVLGL